MLSTPWVIDKARAQPHNGTMKRTSFGLLIFILLAFVLFPPPTNAFLQPRIDPRVLQDTANGQTASFLVILKSQANVRAATARASSWQAQGRMAYAALQQAANASQPAVRAHLDSLGVAYRSYTIVNMLVVDGDRSVVDAMAARSDVLAIESNRAFQVPLEQPGSAIAHAPTSIRWNISKINAPALWALGYTGQGMTYANADTGVQWDHSALKPQYRGWNGSSADHNYNWWDAIHSDLNGDLSNTCGFSLSIPCDDQGYTWQQFGHGTHTMGTGIGSDGSEYQIGVAPGAKWIACRNMENGWGSPSTYIECMEFFLAPWDLAKQNGDPDKRPHAIGNSYGCPTSEGCISPGVLQSAVDHLRAAGVFMSVSAGNDGSGCSSIIDPPSFYDSAITIGATDSNDWIAGFSSRGPVTIDGSNRRKPDLVAPGVNIQSSVPGNGYAASQGTSMASPHVAGAVVLLWSAVPSLARNVDATETLLEQSAVHLMTTQGCGGDTSYQVPNNVYGYGRIDVLAAYQAAVTPPTPATMFFPFISR